MINPMNTWRLLARGFPFRNKFRALCFCWALFICFSCGVARNNSDVYKWEYDEELKERVYSYVEDWPTYNEKEWDKELTIEFGKSFTYRRGENEAAPGRIDGRPVNTKLVWHLLICPR